MSSYRQNRVVKSSPRLAPSQELDMYLANNYVNEADSLPIFANRLNSKMSSYVPKELNKGKQCTFHDMDELVLKLGCEHKLRLQKYRYVYPCSNTMWWHKHIISIDRCFNACI